MEIDRRNLCKVSSYALLAFVPCDRSLRLLLLLLFGSKDGREKTCPEKYDTKSSSQLPTGTICLDGTKQRQQQDISQVLRVSGDVTHHHSSPITDNNIILLSTY